MKAEPKFLGISTLAVAALLLAAMAWAQAPAGGAPPAAGGAPPGAAPAGGAPAAGGPPPTGGAAGGAPPIGGGAPPESGGVAPAAAPEAPAPAETAAPPPPPPEPIYENVPREPHPAFMEPLAAHSLMLDVTEAGSRLVAVGAHGDIVVSDDEGASWVQSRPPVREMLTSVAFADAQHGWAVGHDAVILHTQDGGKSWQLQHFDPKLQAPFLAVYAFDTQHAIALGAFGLLMQTVDGGKTWTQVAAENIVQDQLNFYDMTRLGDGELLIAGEQGLVDVSSDGGATWRKLKTPYVGSYFGALPTGDEGALIFGLRGHVYYSANVDGGVWTQVQTGTVASFYGGARLKDGRFALVGASGAILLVAADGSSARLVPGPSDQDYDAALPVGDGLVLAGMRGMQRLQTLP